MIAEAPQQVELLTPAWTPLRPHKIQNELWNCTKRFVHVPAGRGSGKTEIAKRKLIMSLPELKEWGDPRYFFGAPTQEQAKRIAWNHLKQLCPDKWKVKVSDSELFIRTIFGSELWVAGMDKPQRLEGVQWDGCVIDESCDHRPKMFDLVVLPMLTHRYGWAWRIGVPKRQGPGAAEFRDAYETAITGDYPDMAGFNWPSKDILAPDQLAYMQTVMDPLDYMEQFEAIFQTAGGGIFHSFSRDESVRPCIYDPGLPLIVGMDFNVDPMVWIVGQYHIDTPGGRLDWIKEQWQRNTHTQKALDTLFETWKHHKAGFRFYPDATSSARKTSAGASLSDLRIMVAHEGFRKLGRTVHARRANPPVADRFASTNAALLNYAGQRRMFFDKQGCPKTIKDFEARFYKPGTRDPADTGVLGHPSDAVGYATYALFPLPRVAPEGLEQVTITGV